MSEKRRFKKAEVAEHNRRYEFNKKIELKRSISRHCVEARALMDERDKS